MGLFLSLFFGFVPMFVYAAFIYWLDRYEKEPKLLLGGVFLWGAFVASAGAFLINTTLGVGVYALTGSDAATELTTGAIVAPVVEESLKGLAVLLVFLLFRREFDSLLDGVIYAAVAALGFAATENAYYIYQYGYLEEGLGGLLWLVFVRVLLVGWQHPFYTAFTGIGLAAARLSRRPAVKLFAPLTGLTLAVIAHSLHNTLASLWSGGTGLIIGTALDWSGWAFMFVFILWAVVRERAWIRRHLLEEMELGLLTPEQYRVAGSAWAIGRARFAGLFQGRFGPTSRFYQVCAELAHKKQQLTTLGDEDGNTLIVAGLRDELTRLREQI
ncbi:MAG TPA: PrsW family intramembrane metalloprotease [Anaerolineales bacterium]|nr:PrsW family intramembrane metalloprotease [Anaerolineales bacterium]